MKAKEFAEMCYAEKEIQLKEYMNGNESLVAKLKNDLALSTEQEKILYKLVDTVLTDTYLTLLYALDGTASLGNGIQENFKLYGEDGELVFDSGELEMATYEAFYENKKIISYSLEDSMEIQGVNSKVELALVSKVLRERKNTSLMEDGVILIDPATTYIDDEVKIGKDTTIYPNVTLQGNTEIGENSEILSGTRIIDSKIYDNVRIESSVIEESIVENGVTIGPYAHLRPKSHLKENVHIGNFVETKKSTLEKGVKAGHLTYLGDAHIGEKTNIGAGTITCNYDGKNKFKTEVGKEVFIGSDTMLVAPVNIGDNSLIGAGSVITKDVPSGSLSVERSKQIIKEGWKK